MHTNAMRIESAPIWSWLCALLVLLFSAPVLGSTYTIQLPAPNHVDDTAVLQAALDECVTAHPAGCTIQLSAGKYLTAPLSATGFHGSLVGKGMDTTIVEAITPFPGGSSLYAFTDSDVAMSDLTLRVTAYQPDPACQPQPDTFCQPFALVAIDGTTSSARMNRVAFEGAPGPDLGFGAYNLYGGLIINGSPEIKGDVRVTGSRFKNMSEGIRTWGVADSRLTIGGSAANGNSFDNQILSMFVMEAIRSAVDISQNSFQNVQAGGVAILVNQSLYPHDPAIFSFQHNAIHLSGDTTVGIIANDFADTPQKSPFSLSSNDISFVNCPDCFGILTEYTKSPVISSNRLSGAPSIGIWIWANDGCVVRANDLRNLTPSKAGIVLDTDTIDVPSIPTTNCAVVGSHPQDTVYVDPGSATGNNVLVGVNNMGGHPPGPALRNAMLSKNQLRKAGMMPPK